MHFRAISFLFIVDLYSVFSYCSTMELDKSFIVKLLIIFSAIIVALVFAFSHGFEPKEAEIPCGSKLNLTCNSDGYWERCKFTLHNIRKSCDFQWKRGVSFNKTMECSDFGRRSPFFGTYKNYECDMELDNQDPNKAAESEFYVNFLFSIFHEKYPI